ncbi:probable UDP-sugar transporter protein SLC35A4 [Trichosurus vulpecula]|uniref:probable UDP-sugar transporter protein SLC35A4 n=1 Tax=Trichosurus vulpecula TaxID=9337 RepID=UPI00186B0D9B|nr:probable UDP-sugar transporter protein SLC35A4 [Trichosurus vulpecula]XP_036605541.1 probable UDP-sugar transporter protein SLC35A4 [Trichosurus vulpecula]
MNVEEGGIPGIGRPSQARWVLMLLLSTTMYGAHAPLLALCRIDGRVPFRPSSAVLWTELTKLLLSACSLMARRQPKLWDTPPWRQAAPFALSALLYGANNNLVIHLQRYMDPSTYQVMSNLKIGSTALLYCLCLNRRLSARQGLALLLLTGAGACYAAAGLQDPRGLLPAPPAAAMPLHVTPLGLLLLLVYCLISGLSSVYTELLMKKQRLPLALQNLFLYSFGVLMNLGLYVGGGPGPGLLEGFSAWAGLVVLSQALNGLLMSAIMKHGSSITRLFVVSSSLIVNAVLSAALLHLQLTAAFFLALLLIGLAVHLYYGGR